MNTNDSLSLFTDIEEHALPPFSMSEHARGCQNLNNRACKESTKLFLHAPVEHPHHSQNGVCFVTIDSFEPDSDGEENVSLYEEVSLKTEAGGNLHFISNTICELQKDSPNEMLSEFSNLNHTCVQDSISQGSATTLSEHSTLDLYTAAGSLSASSISEDEATGVGIVDLCESQQNKSKSDLIEKCNLEICSDNNTGGAKTDPTNEPVVRPKIRKTYPTVSSVKDTLITDENGKEAKSSRREKRESDANLQKSSKVDKVNSAKEPGSVCVEGAQKKKRGTSKDILTPPDSKPLVDDTFWDDFEVYGLKIMDSAKDEESSECSDGEWSTCLPPYFSGDKDHSSSDESWETLPGKEEHEVQSNSSSLEEENSDFCFQLEEQTSLEDGEIPWLQYHEDVESSTDEENEIGNHYLPPGFFILDGNNNLEDDSSMSEDLEVEWRLLDDFGEGIGVAQAMSYMDPQFLTYMALEERLAHAMETALAHLESLAVDVEQAHPPATKESIECLPQIILTDGHIIVGQEQCCAICCSEYIKDDILTELPCHHLFHKPCVTLWLQKSGTCPVCRHVLPSVLPETAAATSFLSDHDSPPSIHNAAGTR
ncbi:PREDICTED: E3 ubiquitin-protein ligase Praja-2 isoform X2 [Nanorana parkeri]|nr:PREDICTED: E3 ubiquitin-protein ligase Praja-2 isoform X2 [Nanorana parkeri]